MLTACVARNKNSGAKCAVGAKRVNNGMIALCGIAQTSRGDKSGGYRWGEKRWIPLGRRAVETAGKEERWRPLGRAVEAAGKKSGGDRWEKERWRPLVAVETAGKKIGGYRWEEER